MQKVTLLAIMFFISFFSMADEGNGKSKNVKPNSTNRKDFQGILKYVEYTPFDTTYYKVFISDGKIRVETFLSSNDKVPAEKVMIYDIKKHQVLAIKPAKKMYKLLNAEENNMGTIEGCQVISNTKNSKTINGKKCYQYRVINKTENTDVTYWIPKEEFTFYSKMLKMRNSMQRVHKYFFMLPNYQVAFPLQTVERSLMREEKSSFKVLEMTETTVNENLFTIPAGYVLNE